MVPGLAEHAVTQLLTALGRGTEIANPGGYLRRVLADELEASRSGATPAWASPRAQQPASGQAAPDRYHVPPVAHDRRVEQLRTLRERLAAMSPTHPHRARYERELADLTAAVA